MKGSAILDAHRGKRGSFIQGVKEELKNVNWTAKEPKHVEIIKSTKIVLASIFSFGMAIYFADLSIKGALDFLELIVKRAIGA